MGNAEVLWSEKKTDSADEVHSEKRTNSSDSGGRIRRMVWDDGGNKTRYHQQHSLYIYLERIMDVIRDRDTGVRIQGHNINNLKFADDIDMIEEDTNRLYRKT